MHGTVRGWVAPPSAPASTSCRQSPALVSRAIWRAWGGRGLRRGGERATQAVSDSAANRARCAARTGVSGGQIDITTALLHHSVGTAEKQSQAAAIRALMRRVADASSPAPRQDFSSEYEGLVEIGEIMGAHG